MTNMPASDYSEIDLGKLSDHDLLLHVVVNTNALCAHVKAQNGRINALERWKFWVIVMFAGSIGAGLLNGEVAGELLKVFTH